MLSLPPGAAPSRDDVCMRVLAVARFNSSMEMLFNFTTIISTKGAGDTITTHIVLCTYKTTRSRVLDMQAVSASMELLVLVAPTCPRSVTRAQSARNECVPHTLTKRHTMLPLTWLWGGDIQIFCLCTTLHCCCTIVIM